MWKIFVEFLIKKGKIFITKYLNILSGMLIRVLTKFFLKYILITTVLYKLFL